MAERFIEFEWNSEKAQFNLKKHGVSFEEAQTAFDDEFARIFDDPDHSLDEHREILIGQSEKNRLIFVSYTERESNRIRLISARKADAEERTVYEEKKSIL